MDNLNKIYSSILCFKASLNAGQTARKNRQLKPEFIHRKGVWKSIWNYSLCFHQVLAVMDNEIFI
jgi:hypothetical protein